MSDLKITAPTKDKQEQSIKSGITEVEALETLVIDIPNKKFEVNGIPFGEAHNFSLSFEDGIWFLSVELPHKFKAEWKKFDTQGNAINLNK